MEKETRITKREKQKAQKISFKVNPSRTSISLRKESRFAGACTIRSTTANDSTCTLCAVVGAHLLLQSKKKANQQAAAEEKLKREAIIAERAIAAEQAADTVREAAAGAPEEAIEIAAAIAVNQTYLDMGGSEADALQLVADVAVAHVRNANPKATTDEMLEAGARAVEACGKPAKIAQTVAKKALHNARKGKMGHFRQFLGYASINKVIEHKLGRIRQGERFRNASKRLAGVRAAAAAKAASLKESDTYKRAQAKAEAMKQAAAKKARKQMEQLKDTDAYKKQQAYLAKRNVLQILDAELHKLEKAGADSNGDEQELGEKDAIGGENGAHVGKADGGETNESKADQEERESKDGDEKGSGDGKENQAKEGARNSDGKNADGQAGEESKAHNAGGDEFTMRERADNAVKAQSERAVLDAEMALKQAEEGVNVALKQMEFEATAAAATTSAEELAREQEAEKRKAAAAAIEAERQRLEDERARIAKEKVPLHA